MKTLGIALMLFGLCALPNAVAQAQQSFLDKLEQAVKQQLNERPATEQSTGDLPAPSKDVKNEAKGTGDDFPKLQPSVPLAVPPPPRSAPKTGVDGQVGKPEVLPEGGASSRPAIATGEVRAKGRGRVYLGLEAEEFGGGEIGVRVVAVTVRSPAWKAGFQVGDSILAVNGYAVANLEKMAQQMAKTSPGETVDFLIQRNERNKELKAVLMDADLASRTIGAPAALLQTGEPHLGVVANDLTASFRDQFGLKVYSAAAISNVTIGSPAHRAGIRAGDAIVEAGGFPIESADALLAWLGSTRPGQEVRLTVHRGSTSRNVELIMGISPNSRKKFGGAEIDYGPLAIQEPTIEPDRAPPLVPQNLTGEVAEVQELRNVVGKLQDENAKLRKQLQETQAKLDQIMQLLKNR